MFTWRSVFLSIFIILFFPVIIFTRQIKPGVVITSDNYGQYIAELKKLLPGSKYHWVVELGLKKGLITIPIVETKFLPLPKGLVEATKKNRGKCSIGEQNELIGWTAGYPFLKPKNALELVWNAYPDVGHGSAPDQGSFPAWFGLYSTDKFERSFEWIDYKTRYMGRTDISPTPQLNEALTRGVLSKESTIITKPHDVRGFTQIRIRYWDVNEDDDVFSYIPALRRIRRLTGRDVNDPILGSDCILDDFETMRQKINPKMTFKILGEGNFIVPCTYAKKPPEPFLSGPCHQSEWEIRTLYILEVMVNDPDYIYSKRVVYVDKDEGWFTIYWGEGYDQQGRLWRANGTSAVAQKSYKEESLKHISHRNLFGWVYMNCQTKHYTVLSGDPIFELYDIDKIHSIKGLLKMAR